MINDFALNLGVDAGLALAHGVMNAVLGSPNQPVSVSDNTGAADSGGQGVFAKMLNDSINGSSAKQPAVNNSAAGNNGNSSVGQADNSSYGGGSAVSGQSPANGKAAGTANNMPAVSSSGNKSSGDGAVSANRENSSGSKSAGGNSHAQTGNTPVNETNNNLSGKSKNDKIKNTIIPDGSRLLFFAGNAGIILQPLSANKAGKGGNTETTGAKPDGKNSGASASMGNIDSSVGLSLSANIAAINADMTDNQSLPATASSNNNNGNTGEKDSAANSSGKTGLSAIADNAGKKISDNASGQNTQASQPDQSAADKTGDTEADKNLQNPIFSNILHNIAQKAVPVSVNAGNQNNRKAASAELAENAAVKSAASNNTAAAANADILLKDAAANAFNLNALSIGVKSALSGADGKNPDSENIGGNAANNGAGAANNLKIADLVNAGSSQGGSLNNPAFGGNFAGLNLPGGNIAGTGDSSGETPGSTFVNSVMFMLKRNVQSATITLTPPSLGSIKIDISLNSLNSASNTLNSSVSGGSITINMLAQNEAAKNILQSSSESLQNALKNQGFSSINLNIGTGSGYNNSQTGGNGNEAAKNPFINNRYNGSSFANTAGSGAASPGLNVAAYRNPDALIDYFV